MNIKPLADRVLILPAPAEEKTMSAAASEKKSFTVIEIPTSEAQTLNKTEDGTPEKPKRTYRRKVAAAE